MIVTGVGDLLGFPKSTLVNFVVRHVRKQVPEYSLPGSIGFLEALGKGKYENLEPVALGHEDIAFLQYTGGTTGVSKGAVLTRRNMVANVLQTEAWMGPSLRDQTEQMVLIGALPLYHIFSLQGCLTFLKLGAQNRSNPEPSAAIRFVLYSHPTLAERVRLATSYRPWAEGQPNRLYRGLLRKFWYKRG